ncbi:MAG: tetratricopeptide repeat protein [Deltaproteobacteria bacterium]|nr:tetratricopeptide repeat protein [Deltaproteobacteria bacterium]
MAYLHKDPIAPTVDKLKHYKVLVVDDFVNFRRTVKGMLAGLGVANIVDAFDGESALLRLSASKYDIILCDYNLGPGKDGQQVFEEAKHYKYINYMTIFMMVTAESSMDMVMGVVEYMPDDYLMKPFTKQILEKKLLSVLEKKIALREIIQTIEGMDYEKALTLCDETIGKGPKHIREVLRIKGEIFEKRGDHQQTEAFYKEVSAMGKMPWALFGLGKCQYQQGRLEDAKETFTQLIKMNDKVMAAYDWLAKILDALGNPQEAQTILMKATEISPRALKRQRELGAIAHRNQDLKTAVKSLRTAITHGKNSAFKAPSDYTTLAKVLVDADSPQESLSVLGDAHQVFPRDDVGAAVQIGLAESVVYQKLNRQEEARESIYQAIRATEKSPEKVPADVELELAKALILSGDQDKGKEIVRKLIQSNHENEGLITDTKKMFEGINMAQEGQELLDAAVEEVVELNNQGVQLVKQGELAKATSYFDKAVEKLPYNTLINANAAYACMLDLKKNGKTSEGIRKTQKYLERVYRNDPQYRDLPSLLTVYREISKEPLSWMTATL